MCYHSEVIQKKSVGMAAAKTLVRTPNPDPTCVPPLCCTCSHAHSLALHCTYWKPCPQCLYCFPALPLPACRPQVALVPPHPTCRFRYTAAAAAAWQPGAADCATGVLLEVCCVVHWCFSRQQRPEVMRSACLAGRSEAKPPLPEAFWPACSGTLPCLREANTTAYSVAASFCQQLQPIAPRPAPVCHRASLSGRKSWTRGASACCRLRTPWPRVQP